MSESEGDIAAQKGSSAVPGCFVLGTIVTVFGGLLILYATIFFVQKKALGDFTEAEAGNVKLLEPTEAQIKEVNDKLFAIRAATSQSKRERILLSATDLNTMIATIGILKDFRGTTFVESISKRGVETRMTQPMRKMPLTGSQRHLNAKFIFQPELRRRTIALRVIDIISSVGSVPEQFVKNYDTIGFFKLDPDNPDIKPIIPKLSRVYVENGNVVIETGTPADDQSRLEE